MQGPASQLDLLNRLCTAGPFFDSALISKRSNSVYASALAWIERKLGISGSEKRPTKVLLSLPWEGQAFLLKLAAIRSTIDDIASAINSENSCSDESKLVSQAMRLTEIFHLYADSEADVRKLAANGFDTKNIVAEPFPFFVSVWTKPIASEWFSESLAVEKLFMCHMSGESGAEKCVLRDMPEHLIKRVESCLEFLQSISSKLLHDIMLNTRHIAMIDFERWPTMRDDEYREIGQSISSHLVPSCCFFSWHSLNRSEKLAEAIYHEALHKKLSNILVSEPILKDGYTTEDSPRFTSKWNRDTQWNPRVWEFDRALYAFHVYAHLVVFYGALLEGMNTSFFPQEFAISQRRLSIERAKELGDWLSLNSDKCLTVLGIKLVQSLRSAVNESLNISHCCP